MRTIDQGEARAHDAGEEARQNPGADRVLELPGQEAVAENGPVRLFSRLEHFVRMVHARHQQVGAEANGEGAAEDRDHRGARRRSCRRAAVDDCHEAGAVIRPLR
jgi:hypothetical protein